MRIADMLPQAAEPGPPEPPRLPDRLGGRRRRPRHRLPRAGAPRPPPPPASRWSNPFNAFCASAPDDIGDGARRRTSRWRPGHLHRPRHAGRRGARRRLGADARSRARPANAKLYGNLTWGGVRRAPAARRARQLLGAATASAGAAARAMLVAAAAESWKVPAPGSITVENGIVSTPPASTRPSASWRRRRPLMPPPADAAAQGARDFALIGNDEAAPPRHRGQDRPARRASRIDVQLPGMLTAVRGAAAACSAAR